jgi:sugar phosphate isomerase/epimerase
VAGFHAELRRAAGLGARTVLVIPGTPREDVAHETAREWFAAALRDSLEEARRLGVTMMVANVGWQPVVYGTSEQILGICDAVGPELKVTYDVGNFLLSGEDNMRALEREAPRMVHVHFKDWKVVPPPAPRAFPGIDGRLYEGEVLGDGVLNLPEAARRLRQLGYRGWVSVEYEGTGEPREAARRGVAYLRSLLEGA